MKIKKGMTVGIRATSGEYGGRLAGKTGVVVLPACNGYLKVGVLVDGMENPNSQYGYYYFYENELCSIKSNSKQVDKSDSFCSFSIKNVYFNDPVTVVMWQDGTKTIVRCCENDIYDPEMGLAMAISKKALGNKGNYYNQFRKWLPKKQEESKQSPISALFNSIADRFNRADQIFTDCETCAHNQTPYYADPCHSCSRNGFSEYEQRDVFETMKGENCHEKN